MTTAALEEALAELHSEYADYLKTKLREAKSQQGMDGVGPLLNNIRQFLKDNHIEAEPTPDGKDAFTGLVQESVGDNVLPFAKGR